ncbi:hypothetical protein BC832DRAFT_543212 [Gaertneriomyces semiglobifer]|nr:hypothetical protein BC832DRAFT_543212 [Gaertneriomyces semiglobifer]
MDEFTPGTSTSAPSFGFYGVNTTVVPAVYTDLGSYNYQGQSESYPVNTTSSFNQFMLVVERTAASPGKPHGQQSAGHRSHEGGGSGPIALTNNANGSNALIVQNKHSAGYGTIQCNNYLGVAQGWVGVSITAGTYPNVTYFSSNGQDMRQETPGKSIYCAGYALAPSSTDSVYLGSAAVRWLAIYSTNGTVTSSDEKC